MKKMELYELLRRRSLFLLLLVPLLTTRLTLFINTQGRGTWLRWNLGGYSVLQPSIAEGIYAHFDAVAAATGCQLSYMTFR